jgi:hypothetical protein
MQYRAIAEQNRRGVGMDAFRQYSELECQMLDVGWWYGAMTAGTAGNNSILNRMFAILWHGGLYYRPKHGTWRPWSDNDMPIATALSRSGGVVVQYQQRSRFGGHGREETLWEWLFENQQPDHRSHATHGIERGNYGTMPNNQPKNFKENKKDEGNHSGINLAGGGLGNRNPITGKQILEDGRHGHLYFCHTAATMNQPGGFLVKAESSAPLDTADGLFMNSPYWRENPNQRAAMLALSPIWFVPWFGAALVDTLTGGGWARQPGGLAAGAIYPQAQTGDFHALGVSGERGVTGGKKFKSIIKFDENVPYGANGYDVMFVNPTDDTVNRLIQGGLTFDPDDLGRSPPAPALPQPEAIQSQTELRVNAVLVAALRDVIRKYEKEASGFFARSSKESQQVMGWIVSVVGADAANVTYRNGEMPMQGGPLLWTLKYYVRGSGQPAAAGAPAVKLTQGGRLHTMLADVVAEGDQAVARL